MAEKTEQDKQAAAEQFSEQMQPLSDEQLVSIVEDNLDAADAYYSSKVGSQRDKAYRYYYGEQFGGEMPGRSKYVSRDVWDAVEGSKDALVEIFCADDAVVYFEAQNEDDTELATTATQYANYVFYRSNDGFSVIEDICHDGLLSKTAIVKTYWKSEVCREQESFEGLDEQQMQALMMQEGIEPVSIQAASANMQTPQGMMQVATYSGEILRSYDKSKTCVETIPPEDFFIQPEADSIETSSFVAVRYRRMVGELVADGYDPDLVDRIINRDDQWSQSRIYRDTIDSGGLSYHDTAPGDTKDRRYVTVYDCYIKIDANGDGEQELLRVFMGRGQLLDVETVSKVPFRAWCPHRLSHRFYGMSEADVTMDIQRTKSSLVRGILDNCYINNTSRTIANLKLIRNPKDLIENRIGAVIDSDAPSQAIVPLPAAQISPLTNDAMMMLEAEKQSRVAATSTAQGRNDAVISNQNAEDMIDKYIGTANRRVMRIARSMAEFMKNVMWDIIDVGIEYEDPQKIAQLTQTQFQVPLNQWRDRLDCKANVALTPEDRRNRAAMLLMLDTKSMQDPVLAQLQTVQTKHNLMKDVYKLSGVMNYDAYMTDPASEEFAQQAMMQQQQSEQMLMMQQQMQQMQIQMQQQQLINQTLLAQAQAAKLQSDMQIDTRKTENDEFKVETDVALKKRQQDHDRVIDFREQNRKERSTDAEIAIEQQQYRAANIN